MKRLVKMSFLSQETTIEPFFRVITDEGDIDIGWNHVDAEKTQIDFDARNDEDRADKQKERIDLIKRS